MPTIPHTVRWFLVPVAAISDCTGSMSLISAAGRGIDRVAGVGSVEAIVPLDISFGLMYGVAAFVFVAVALVAPSHQRLTAIVLYACGATLAWSELRHWYFPENYSLGYQSSGTPLVFTLVGGLIGVLAVIAYDRYRREVVGDGYRS